MKRYFTSQYFHFYLLSSFYIYNNKNINSFVNGLYNCRYLTVAYLFLVIHWYRLLFSDALKKSYRRELIGVLIHRQTLLLPLVASLGIECLPLLIQ